MRCKVQEIEGTGPAYGKKLGAAGIVLAGDLLKTSGTASDRRAVAAVTGLIEAQLPKWPDLADLSRISGIGKQLSELLEAAGVDTVKEPKNRNADNLAAKMRNVNAAKRLAPTTPSAHHVGRWVEQAKGLKPSVTH
jgi:predicted flap endonuclease-1-like 5' DNA nuclease